MELARACGLEVEDSPQIEFGFLLHDVGKVAVPDAILFKSGALTAEEYSLVRRHHWPSESVLEALREIDEFRIQSVEIGRPLMLLTLDLVERLGLTSYDASYLALAITEPAELLTLDADLAAAAGDRAVSLDPGHRLHELPEVYEHEVTWPNYKEASRYLAKLRAEALAGRPG